MDVAVGIWVYAGGRVCCVGVCGTWEAVTYVCVEGVGGLHSEGVYDVCVYVCVHECRGMYVCIYM